MLGVSTHAKLTRHSLTNYCLHQHWLPQPKVSFQLGGMQSELQSMKKDINKPFKQEWNEHFARTCPNRKKEPNAEDICITCKMYKMRKMRKMRKMCKMCTAKRPGETCQPNFTVLLNFDWADYLTPLLNAFSHPKSQLDKNVFFFFDKKNVSWCRGKN